MTDKNCQIVCENCQKAEGMKELFRIETKMAIIFNLDRFLMKISPEKRKKKTSTYERAYEAIIVCMPSQLPLPATVEGSGKYPSSMSRNNGQLSRELRRCAFFSQKKTSSRGTF